MKHNLNSKKEFNYSLNRLNNDGKTGILKFSQYDEKYPLYDLQKDELKEFISFAKKFESLPWRSIKMFKGFKFENIPNISMPDNLEKDITLTSLRVTEKFRLIGYRQEEYFYIVWFDRNHLTYKG